MNKKSKLTVTLLFCVLLSCVMIGCGTMKDSDHSFQKLEDFAKAKIGIITGSAHDLTAKEFFPEAERVYFNMMADMVLAVEQGKIDGYLEDEPYLTALLWEGANVQRLEESLSQMDNGFIFPQDESSYQLRQEINSFLKKVKEDGTIEALLDKWLGEEAPSDHPDYGSLAGENGTIRLAVSVDNKPLTYKYKDQCTGFEMELLTMFGQEYGYAFDIEVLPFESIVAGIAAGKYDMAASGLNITAEREESVDFSDPYATFDVVIVAKDNGQLKEQGKKSVSDFENARLGIMTGSVYDSLAKEQFPNGERRYYSMMSDMILAVEQGKLDAYISETPYAVAAIWEGAKIDPVAEPLAQAEAAYIFQKGDDSIELRSQLDEYITRAEETGLLEELEQSWFGNSEPQNNIDFNSLTGENGTIRVAAAADLKPVSYIRNGKSAGYEIDLLARFAKEYGYKLDITVMNFDAILPGITTGKYDVGAGGIIISEERAESLAFSKSHLIMDVVLVAKEDGSQGAGSGAANVGFWDDLKEGFEKTFIREERWKLILDGTKVTVLISICSAVLGTLLGFGLYMLGRSEMIVLKKVSKGIAKVYSRIVAGTPVVVILMILFYVVFGNFKDISGILVAIIGFTLTFGAFVYDHMIVSVNSVDRGQTEAAHALGYTKTKAFFRIIFPQAMTVFIPSYCGQVVDLVKATAVVGYIAVNDLTKMGDIIRSNTYEAFFPLIATAVIYFLLTWIFSLLLGIVKRRFEPKRRSKEEILKGVKTV